MNATNRLDLLLTDIVKTQSNKINQETSIEPLSKLTFNKTDAYPSTMITRIPLTSGCDSSSIKSNHRRHQNDQIDKQKQYQPLLNSSTLDDLFRALTLECEQYLANVSSTSSSYQNKTSNQMIIKPSFKIQTTVDSNDDDYENLNTSRLLKTKNGFSPLKTSIEVISPIKRHVVSITISSKITSPRLKSSTCITSTSIIPSTIHHSSEDDSINISSSSTNRKHRRRRARKQIISSTSTRSSSSSNERKETDKKLIISKRSCSTDYRYQQNRNLYDNNNFISQKQQQIRRPRRRDISLQHSFPISERRSYDKYSSSPLSVLLTSTTNDFVDNSQQQRKQRRSRLESIDSKQSTLLDRMHQQFYRPTSNRNNNNNNSTHRIKSYPIY